MWASGWRKSSDKYQIIGRYIKKISKTLAHAFDQHYQQSSRLGAIIGKHFKQLGEIPFGAN